jgi:hypothetical protein
MIQCPAAARSPVCRAADGNPIFEGRDRVTGVDISPVQVRRARSLVPAATFRCADATTVRFPARSFDAVVLLLATVGHQAWTGSEEDWHGATMWWSHADAATYRTWLTDAGLHIEAEEFFPEGNSGHAVFWAVRRW